MLTKRDFARAVDKETGQMVDIYSNDADGHTLKKRAVERYKKDKKERKK